MQHIRLLILTGFILSFMSTSFSQDLKWGYLNTEELLMEMPEADQAELQVEAEMEKMEKAFEALSEQYDQLMGGDNSNDPKAIALQTKMQNMEREMDLASESIRQKYYNKIYLRIEGAVADIAKEKQLEYVIDTAEQKLLYANESANILELVKARLNLK